jgi:hypothetical protein
MTILVAYVLKIGHWEICLFLGGMLLAEIQFLRREMFPEQSPALNDLTSTLSYKRKWFIKHLQKYLQHLLTICLLFMGLFLVSFPDLKSEDTPGLVRIHEWTPEPYRVFYLFQKFWNTLGTFLVLTAISFSPPMYADSRSLVSTLREFQFPFLNDSELPSYSRYVSRPAKGV